eukprot:GHRR01025558.1.p1 GENE.GHRR01025558.1~~GHRR01025558.1.p1  ORF type:complete len:485 (+),score=178.00 GHRR01025558.1:669-2123(+)
MGIAAQQQRTDAYMHTHTISGQALLDPTSRRQPYPSQNMVVKPAGFGLGRAGPEAISKVAARHPGTQATLADTVLLPSKYRNDMQADSLHSKAADSTRGFRDTSSTGAAPNSSPGTIADDDGTTTNTDDMAIGDEEALAAEGLITRDQERTAAATAGQTGGGRNSNKSSRESLPVAVLSKLEADKLAQAKVRHKAQVAQPKINFGRTFTGDAFIAEPAEVLFKDFVPGRTYKTSVQLINRSFTKNSIRLVEVPAEVMHVIELGLPPSGSLAPGAAAAMAVTFIPQANEDLTAGIRLLAETGPLTLPLRCLARTALPTLGPSPLVSLDGRAGGVMIADTAHATVTLCNRGALGVVYDIKVTGLLASTTEYDEPSQHLRMIAIDPHAADAPDAATDSGSRKGANAASLAVAGFRVQSIKGQVSGYGSCTIEVSFTPRVPGVVEVPLVVSYTAPENKALSIPQANLTLQATGKDLPVSTTTPLVDFR